MRSGSRLLQRYIAGAVIPYILLAFLLLTAILLAQQSSRFAEILVTSRVPLSLFADVTAALIPNVIVLTLPIAVLTGTVVGFSRLGSDSEMVAIRNAGLSTWSVLWPVLLVGIIGTGCAAYVNFDAAPQSAGLLRQAGVQAALTKMNSPIDPRSFNLDMPGYVIYVRDGDKIKGEWGRIFIYSKEKTGGTRVITAKTGRMDTTGDQSELVLTDAVATALPASDNEKNSSKFTVEHLETLRVGLDTGRKPLLEKLRQAGDDPDEAGIGKLLQMVRSSGGKEKREAVVLLHKRVTLALSPLLFSLLGAAIGLRVRKGGRALGVFLSIICTLGYYLVALIGDQMARAGTVPVVVGIWLATIAALLCSLVLLWLSPGRGLPRISFPGSLFKSGRLRKPVPSVLIKTRTLFSGFPSLLDAGVLKSLATAFVVSVSALTGLVVIFTVFELWRYIIDKPGGFALIGQYLVFLLPFVLIQVIPASTLLAVLSTYALMARRSENIAWWASGQSVFRLFLPGILFSMVIGFGTWYLQEQVTPRTNIRQDLLRSQLKNQVPRTVTSTGRQWLASLDSQRLYSFDYTNHESEVDAMVLFEFDNSGTHLARIVRAGSARWLGIENIKLTDAEVFGFTNQMVTYEHAPDMQIPQTEKFALFKPSIDKPSQLNAKQLSEYIKLNKQRGVDVAGMLVALYRKYAEPFGAIVMMMLGAPLALSFGRKNVVAGLCIAILVGIAFWAASGGFQQLGSLGLLPAAVAALAPFAIFGSVGLYLLSRTRT